DLEGAFWLGAKSLTVVTPSGYRYVYIRGTNGMELAAVINDPNYVANPSWREDVESSTAFWTQTLAEKGNQPEWIMRQEEREDGIYTPVGLTVEQTYRLFAADKERIQRLKLPLGAYHNTRDQHRLSPWEDMWTKDPESWTDYGILEKLGPIIQSAAERWNHPESGMSDYEVAILLIANLHQESRFRRTSGVAGLLEDNGHQSIGWIGDKLGDMSILLSFWPIHSNPSLGPANLRATVADEMLQGELSIPMLQGENLELEDWQLDAEQLNSLNNLREEWREFRWDDHRGRLLFLSDDMKAIELAAINFYRGVERLQDGELQPTMFNMSAWMSQGIAESATLSTHDIGVVAGAIEHASDTVRFVNAIIANRETFGMFGDSEEIIDWDDFDLFNDNDLLAYLRDY
ncbi:MAG: hypothetical protein OXG60_05535, partial [Chloroflexi bacterium]|nr:hypothetical protein [Chloroflexota bacterium]